MVVQELYLREGGDQTSIDRDFHTTMAAVALGSITSMYMAMRLFSDFAQNLFEIRQRPQVRHQAAAFAAVRASSHEWVRANKRQDKSAISKASSYALPIKIQQMPVSMQSRNFQLRRTKCC